MVIDLPAYERRLSFEPSLRRLSLKPFFEWVPSQKGLLFDPPQRHSATLSTVALAAVRPAQIRDGVRGLSIDEVIRTVRCAGDPRLGAHSDILNWLREARFAAPAGFKIVRTTSRLRFIVVALAPVVSRAFTNGSNDAS